ncbi:NADH-quinone oxidoreductase subunit A [Parapedobacter sp. ISTM3]|uniref:NADH-quinone oxidoreductase subunit A n=1 Tax=Parapedobacter luteus TaxID=623280 RepID=A0A1T5EL71_9SPHI|nr:MULTISPECIES: NADH-quinone oxidoreductase subunit A [Parapedobacter]MBK1441343.1 NADH-quinone oxidoreductase subunit A [Parapedobacter sp. ISTM3]SKB84498.1 NADH-quinone oxidoreductase subunit A [Parapedobacter luteus]
MDDPSQITEFGKILLIGVTGIVLVLFTLFLGKLVSPQKPNPEKLSTYECGEETVGNSWIPFNSRFYVIALVFLLFDVELVFVFPWATVFGRPELISADTRWGWFTLAEMAVFIGILIIGLVYVWRKGDLEWVKPRTILPQVKVNIPPSAYDKLKRDPYRVRPFEAALQTADKPQIPGTVPAVKKPAFKPLFRKPGAPPSS